MSSLVAGSTSPKDCPRCGLTNPAIASRCDCGHEFTTGRTHTVEPQRSSGMNGSICSAGSLLIGICLTALPFVHRFAALGADLDVAMAITDAAIVLTVVGIVLGAVGRGPLRWPGVVFCAIALLEWVALWVGTRI